MYVFISILILIASILLILIVLIQNSKGGGLASGFSSSNQIMGVRKTTDFLEKATWSLAGAVVVLSIIITAFIPDAHKSVQSEIQQAAVLVARMQAQSLDDAQALTVKAIYPQWSEVIGQTVKQGFKFLYSDVLYKVIQPDGLTIQDQYIPGEGTESLYVVINETNAGTQEDPIPYAGNMALENGKYYSQDGAIYLCNRDTEIPVYQALKDLVNIYVTTVE